MNRITKCGERGKRETRELDNSVLRISKCEGLVLVTYDFNMDYY